MQNFPFGASSEPQFVQLVGRTMTGCCSTLVPHSKQNLALAGNAAPQLVQDCVTCACWGGGAPSCISAAVIAGGVGMNGAGGGAAGSDCAGGGVTAGVEEGGSGAVSVMASACSGLPEASATAPVASSGVASYSWSSGMGATSPTSAGATSPAASPGAVDEGAASAGLAVVSAVSGGKAPSASDIPVPVAPASTGGASRSGTSTSASSGGGG